MSKDISLQTQLVTIFGLCLFLTVGVVVGYGVMAARTTEDFVTRSSSAIATAAAQEQLVEKAKTLSYAIEVELEVALNTARTLANTLAGTKDPGVNLTIDRERINGILRSTLVRNDSFVGVYTLWEPNALDELDDLYAGTEGYDQTGRFIPYWSRRDNGAIGLEPLVDYENHEKLENGVRKGEWYLLPRERTQECAIDPLPYPVQGKLVWMTSLVVPIVVDDAFYGITGVDLRLDFVQALAEQVNQEFYRGAGNLAVVSHNGILAAVSNHAELVGKPLQHWLPQEWQAQIEDIRAGRERIDIRDGAMQVLVPLHIGRTGMLWG